MILLNRDVHEHIKRLMNHGCLQSQSFHPHKHIIRTIVMFFFSSRRRHTRCYRDWSSDVCSSDLPDQVTWTSFAPGTPFPLQDSAGEDSGLRCCALALGTHYPAYVSLSRQGELTPGESSLGLMIGLSSGKRLAYLPAVPQIDEALMKEIEAADVLLFDGTFWSDDELIRVQGSGKTAHQMGHVPVSSAEGSLGKLAGLRRPRKIYIHINNTNPMLNEAGPEYRRVREAGWEIAEDGWQLDL